MKSISYLFLILFSSLTAQAQIPTLQKASDKAQNVFNAGTGSAKQKEFFLPAMLVNPLIGTGGHGHTFPGVCAPFGMMQLSPDTRYDGWDGCGGYHYSDSIIYGFSHTHLSGTGVPDYGDLLVVPQSGEAKWKGKFEDSNGYGAAFSHDDEIARLGFYEVLLKDENIRVNLSCTERAGIHQYTFLNSTEKKYILLDLNYRDKLTKGEIKLLDKQNISGYRVSEAWANEQHFYFHLTSSIPYSSYELKDQNGELKLLLEFPMDTKELLIKVGMSHVDVAGAKINLDAEIPHFSLDRVYAENQKKWEQEFEKISLKADRETSSIFYTALYHSMVAPNLMSDVDGRYRGRDQQIHQLDNLNDRQYTVFSLWDTYRANHPLFTIIDQKRTGAYIRTFLRQYEEGGDLPVWELAACETECMIGYHSVSVISDAYMKGIRDFDADKALKAMVSTAKANEFGKIAYAQNGLISSADEPESVSRTLEYAYDDFCIATMASALGNKAVALEFEKRSTNFVNLYDPNTQFMRARRGAQWYGPFDPSEVNFNYTEANSWQYSLYAPQHIEILINLLGGPDSLETWLDRLFTTDMKLSGREQADITGLIGQYAHGNEPSHHMAYLYNFTNAPHKTQAYVDRILNEMYHNAPDGLSGNEDCGQMSAWYVLSTLGIYPIAPGKPVYQIGRPLINSASIKLENGKSIQINCVDQSKANKYIQSVSWNGQPLEKLEISHEQLMQGGVLSYVMGAAPKARAIEQKEMTFKLPAFFAPVPFIKTEQRVFNDSLWIEIDVVRLNQTEKSAIETQLFYQIDGKKWQSYQQPFAIYANTNIRIKAGYKDLLVKRQGLNYWSAEVAAAFIKKDPNVQLQLESTYSNQYTASGKDALIDGLRGGNEFRTGDFQGYYNQDVVAIIEFKDAKTINSAGISFIRDQKAWIFAPSKITIEASVNGTDYFTIAQQDLPQASPSDKNPFKDEVLIELDSDKQLKYKSLRYTISNPGLLPSWHLGAGNPTWLFIDELLYK
ncbi:MAG: GH92 family glycosyl hydrolase [Crocinitomicaceae bacterium]|nr:GH92 family glycosyl hydrolase [Crocinitomicaceae bacterium]